MFRLLKFILLFSIVLFMAVGYPLTNEGGQQNFAEEHPQETSRCFTIGDLNSLMSCLNHPFPRLNGLSLVETVGSHMNMTSYPFGYLFFICLALFLIFAIILI